MIAILIIIALILVGYYFLIKPQLFWKSINVPQGPPIPLFGDTIKTTFGIESFVDFVKRYYKQHRNKRYFGFYQTGAPILMLNDPEIIKKITVKDFDHFVDHFNFAPDDVEPIWSKNLFSLKGDKWRTMRATLSPTFTSSKMRLMFELMERSAEQFVDFFLNQNQNVIQLEMKDSLAKFANDVIANCAFGVTVDSLKNPQNEFYVRGSDISNFATGFWNGIKFLGALFFPKVFKFLGITLFNSETTQFFKNLIKDAIKLREEKNIVRPDMINLLMEARKGKLKYEESSEQKDAGFATAEESDVGKTEHLKQFAMSDDDMTAQVLIFFIAGFDTISTMLSFMCYELAVNPDIQEKLRNEIDKTSEEINGRLTYDVLNKMKYLDMVISESLRKQPPLVAIDRVCTRTYTIEPDNPDEKPVQLKPGVVVWLPVFGMHYDEEYFPNPTKFNPERFSDENKHNIKPYTYFPFGVGPRNCIGSRFALMEIKTLIFHILRNFEFVVTEKTPIPLHYLKGKFTPAIEGGCWLGLKRRQMIN